MDSLIRQVYYYHEKGKRSKVNAVCVISPENDAVIERIKEQGAVIEAEKAKLAELYKSLRQFSVEDMKQ